jgi:methionyl-tRNA formyltransferase
VVEVSDEVVDAGPSPVSVVYVSSLQAGKDCLKLIRDAITIDCVVTIDRKLAEHSQVSGYVDFSDLGFPVRHVHRYSMMDPRDVQIIRDLAPRLVIVNGWNRLIPPAVLTLPKNGCVGFHGSWRPLPFGRGRSPITWAILRGETQFFLHLFHLDDGIDSGDVIDTVRFDITPYDTCASVHGKVAIMSARLLLRNVDGILAGTTARTPQAGEPTYLPKVTAADRLIDWTAPMQTICNLVRAMTRPYGGAFSDIDYQGRRTRMIIWDAFPFSHEIDFEGEAGVIVHELGDKPLIKCRDGIMLVKDFTLVAPPGSP